MPTASRKTISRATPVTHRRIGRVHKTAAVFDDKCQLPIALNIRQRFEQGIRFGYEFLHLFAFIEIDIFLSQIRRINNGVGFAQIEPDMQIKLFLCRYFLKLRNGGIRRLALFQRPEYLLLSGQAVAEIHFVLDHFCQGITQRVQDPAPVWIAAAPNWSSPGRCWPPPWLRHPHRQTIPPPVRANGHKPGNPFAIEHNFLGKLQRDMA